LEPLKVLWSTQAVFDFFANSDFLDHVVLRPLSHVAANWELTSIPGPDLYLEEDNSLAGQLNVLIEEISTSNPPRDYHAYENKLAMNYPEVRSGRYYLEGKLWRDIQSGKLVEKDFVGHMIEQATAAQNDVPDLVLAAAGRVATAFNFRVAHFDDLDRGHMEMLSVIMTDILFRRSDQPAHAT
jgi:hypothetical protein